MAVDRFSYPVVPHDIARWTKAKKSLEDDDRNRLTRLIESDQKFRPEPPRISPPPPSYRSVGEILAELHAQAANKKDVVVEEVVLFLPKAS